MGAVKRRGVNIYLVNSNEGKTKVVSFPYSEHSSFAELQGFVKSVLPGEIVPTVPSSDSAQSIKQYFVDCTDGSSDKGRIEYFMRKMADAVASRKKGCREGEPRRDEGKGSTPLGAAAGGGVGGPAAAKGVLRGAEVDDVEVIVLTSSSDEDESESRRGVGKGRQGGERAGDDVGRSAAQSAPEQQKEGRREISTPSTPVHASPWQPVPVLETLEQAQEPGLTDCPQDILRAYGYDTKKNRVAAVSPHRTLLDLELPESSDAAASSSSANAGSCWGGAAASSRGRKGGPSCKGTGKGASSRAIARTGPTSTTTGDGSSDTSAVANGKTRTAQEPQMPTAFGANMWQRGPRAAEPSSGRRLMKRGAARAAKTLDFSHRGMPAPPSLFQPLKTASVPGGAEVLADHAPMIVDRSPAGNAAGSSAAAASPGAPPLKKRALARQNSSAPSPAISEPMSMRNHRDAPSLFDFMSSGGAGKAGGRARPVGGLGTTRDPVRRTAGSSVKEEAKTFADGSCFRKEVDKNGVERYVFTQPDQAEEKALQQRVAAVLETEGAQRLMGGSAGMVGAKAADVVKEREDEVIELSD